MPGSLASSKQGLAVPPPPHAAGNLAVPGDPGLSPSTMAALQQPDMCPPVKAMATKIVWNSVSELGTQPSPASVSWGHPNLQARSSRTIGDDYATMGSIKKKKSQAYRALPRASSPSLPTRWEQPSGKPHPARGFPQGSAPVTALSPLPGPPVLTLGSAGDAGAAGGQAGSSAAGSLQAVVLLG